MNPHVLEALAKLHRRRLDQRDSRPKSGIESRRELLARAVLVIFFLIALMALSSVLNALNL